MECNEHVKKARIAVIGAGIIGINCALSLQALGYQVTLLDKNGIGEGCSKGNAGHFATEQVFPLAEKNLLWQLPKLLLDPLGPVAISPSYFPKAIPWFLKFIANMAITKRARHIHALKKLNSNAINAYLPWLKEAEQESLISLDGSLLVYENTPLSEIKKDYRKYLDQGVAVKLLTRKDCLNLEPDLHENIQFGLFFTEVGHSADPYLLSQTLAKLAITKGTLFNQFSVDRLDYKPNGITVTDKKTDKTLEFDQVVIATGAWSKKLVNQLGYRLPIIAERGYHLMLNSKDTITRPIASAERRFILTPMTQGLRLAGTVEFAGLNAAPNYKRADMLYTNACEIIKNLEKYKPEQASVEQRWMGSRPSLPDSLPVIGRAPNHEKIYFALGHQHLGLTQGAITGKLIAQLVSGKETDLCMKPFCISRFN